MTKGILTCLEALERGAVTSTEIEATTGLSLKSASAYLSVLRAEGLIVATTERRFYSASGRESIVYRSVRTATLKDEHWKSLPLIRLLRQANVWRYLRVPSSLDPDGYFLIQASLAKRRKDWWRI